MKDEKWLNKTANTMRSYKLETEEVEDLKESFVVKADEVMIDRNVQVTMHEHKLFAEIQKCS